MQPMAVGQKATDIARLLGLSVKPDTKLLIAPIQGVGREHPLSVEKLFPVLAVYRAKSVDEALKVCVDVNHAGGLGHTAVIFSRNDEIIRKFGEVINAGRIIVNSPGSIGALGGVYNDLVPTFSFGCGTGGGNSTTDNVNVYHYLNIKRVARRTQAHMWFRVPNQIYFNMNAVENLRQFPSRSTIIVTNPALEQIGHVDIVRRYIPAETHVHVSVIPDAEPEVKVVMQGVEALNFYKADQIIALGGGSVIDAAKIMKLKYESPEADLEELAAPFLDIRKRVVQYPTEKVNQARLIAISDHQRNGKRSHSVCRPDRQRARAQGDAGRLLADSGRGDRRSAIRHVDAERAYRRYRHRLPDPRAGSRGFHLRFALHRLPTPCRRFGWCSSTCPSPTSIPSDEEARSMMHNAACIAAMAFSNASVGVNHALAHAFGARFGVAHGRANALMLPHVIAYNAAVPTKFMPSPNQHGYRRPQEIRHDRGLAGSGRPHD